MKILEFYEKYNLNHTYFAEMAHVGVKTLIKYDEGKPIRSDSRERIEKAIRTVIKYNHIRPRFNSGESLGFFGFTYRMEFRREMDEYMTKFQTLLKGEGS